MRQQPTKLETARPIDEARIQADAYDSLFASTPLDLGDGNTVMIPPHPDFGMLDDDRMEEYEDLLMAVDEDYEREPDVVHPDQTLENGLVVPGETVRGALKRPYRIKGERVKPAHSIKVVMAAIGPDAYKRLRDAGKSAADVWKIWGRQGLEIQARQRGDSKSSGSDVALEAISEANS